MFAWLPILILSVTQSYDLISYQLLHKAFKPHLSTRYCFLILHDETVILVRYMSNSFKKERRFSTPVLVTFDETTGFSARTSRNLCQMVDPEKGLSLHERYHSLCFLYFVQ